ncbi:hypothetical protein Patl1_01464 [Pistacia atlantica]|uniref:Uncharacterized protein n=1 Tax=Pistacia atlantica TaxID=434234 RepID=A0ACC1C3X2_9ROSI|nr:hypothetical protein Patl1_01464 [Pistacia atlantica]
MYLKIESAICLCKRQCILHLHLFACANCTTVRTCFNMFIFFFFAIAIFFKQMCKLL